MYCTYFLEIPQSPPLLLAPICSLFNLYFCGVYLCYISWGFLRHPKRGGFEGVWSCFGSSDHQSLVGLFLGSPPYLFTHFKNGIMCVILLWSGGEKRRWNEQDNSQGLTGPISTHHPSLEPGWVGVRGNCSFFIIIVTSCWVLVCKEVWGSGIVSPLVLHIGPSFLPLAWVKDICHWFLFHLFLPDKLSLFWYSSITVITIVYYVLTYCWSWYWPIWFLSHPFVYGSQ